MSLFRNIGPGAYEDDEGEESRGSSGLGKSLGKLFGILIGLVFALFLIPAALITAFFHKLLSKARFRISVISLFTIAGVLIAYIIWKITDGGAKFADFFMNLGDAGDTWPTLIAPMLAVNLAIGSIAGLIIDIWSARTMAKTPHLTELEGSWMYKFKYRRTPIEAIRLRRRKTSLATHDLNTDKKVPVGINVEDDELTYRYYNEANKQTLITGGVGSGKALSGGTLIPSPVGFIKARDLEPDDFIFDENGKLTEVLGRYQPYTEDHYDVFFENGVDVRTCGDHRWTVTIAEGDGNYETVLTTRELLVAVRTTDVSVRALSGPVEYPESKTRDDFAAIGFAAARFNFSLRDEHLISSTSQREALLNGALLATGARAGKLLELRSASVESARRLQSVVRSLGLKATDLKVSKEGVHFAFVDSPALDEVLPESNLEWEIGNIEHYAIESVVSVDDSLEDYYCFEVDSDSHLFLCTEDYIPTHNTVSLLSMILSDIKNGIPVIAIDFKRDPEFAARLAYWASQYGRDFHHFTSGAPENYNITRNKRGQSYYDALSSASPAVRADMVLGMREYNEASAVYKSNMQQLLQVLFSAIDEADRSKAPGIDWDSGGINQVASCIEGDNITDLAIACEGKPIQKNIEAIMQASKGKTQIRHALDQLQGQMRTLTSSQYGRWLKAAPGEDRDIDLFKLTNGDNGSPVVLFSIDSDAEADFSSYLGSLILADITNVSALRRNRKLKNQVTVYVDEFQAVPPSAVKSLLEKSRASKLAMTLSLQSFEQIINAAPSNGEAALNGILDTCGNFLIHAGAIEPSAIRLAELQGKDMFTTYKASSKNENFLFNLNWFNRRNQLVQTDKEELWITPPSEFMRLSAPSPSNNFKSTAMFITKATDDERYAGPGALARKIQVIPNYEVLDTNLEEVVEADLEETNTETSAPPVIADADLVIEGSTVEDTDTAGQPDEEWSQEDPDDGDGDFKFVNANNSKPEPPKKVSQEKDIPTYENSMLDDSDLFNLDFKPDSLRKSSKSVEEKTGPTEDTSSALPDIDWDEDAEDDDSSGPQGGISLPPL